jgi:hypothetical protein
MWLIHLKNGQQPTHFYDGSTGETLCSVAFVKTFVRLLLGHSSSDMSGRGVQLLGGRGGVGLYTVFREVKNHGRESLSLKH